MRLTKCILCTDTSYVRLGELGPLDMKCQITSQKGFQYGHRVEEREGEGGERGGNLYRLRQSDHRKRSSMEKRRQRNGGTTVTTLTRGEAVTAEVVRNASIKRVQFLV